MSRRAIGLRDLTDAYRLVHDTFVELGYVHPQPTRLRIRSYEALPGTATFVAAVPGNEGIVGVQSLVPDSEALQLPSDLSFHDEIETLRQGGRRVCEATNEAIAPEFRKTGVPTDLMRCCFAQALWLGYDELITTVSPGHAKFYNLLGFRQISPTRSYSPEINDPVVVVSISLDLISDRADAVRKGSDDDEAFLKKYYLDENPHLNSVSHWAEAAAEAFSDPAILRQLFVERSRLLLDCSQDVRDTIRRCWGEELFSEVWEGIPAAALAGRPLPPVRSAG